MSNFTPKQFILNNVNNGNKYEDGEGIQPSTANDIVQGVAFCDEQREAMVQTPAVVENGGNVGVKWVDTTINGRTHKKLQFENLKGGRNAKGFNPKGVWSALEQYGIDDNGVSWVTYEGNSYYALVEEVPIGTSPENTLYWARGVDGEVNKIDTVKVNGNALPITDKAVNIALADVATSGKLKDLDGRWDLNAIGGSAGSLQQTAYANNVLKADLLFGTLLSAGDLNYWYISGKKNGQAESFTDAILKFYEDKRLAGTRSTVASDSNLTLTTKDYVDSKESASNKKNTLSDSTTEYPSMQAVKRATAIGLESKATGLNSSAYGISADASGDYSNSFGYKAKATKENSLALGYLSQSFKNGVAVGNNSLANETGVAVGSSANAQPEGIAIGHGARAGSTSYGHIAIGKSVDSENGNYHGDSDNVIAIGNEASVYCWNPDSIAIGTSTYIAPGDPHSSSQRKGGAIAIGKNAKISRSAANSYQSLAIGTDAEVDSQIQSTAIGYNAQVTSSDSDKTMRLGATNLSALKCAVALTTSSDTRDKADISTIDSKKCLDIISQVEPIQYVRNDRDYYIDSETKEFDQLAYTQQTKKGNRIRVGVKAQQLKQVLDTVFENDNHSDIVYDNHYDAIKKGETPIGENKLEMSYSKLVPILIGAIQELQKEIEELKNH